MTTPAIEVRNISKRYRNGVLANDGIDLGVPAGSIFGLLGPNGAGKTTLIRQITGQLLPSGGSIHVGGVDVLREPLRAKRLMGVVPQEVSPIEHITARDHFLSFGRLHGLSGAEARRRTEALLAGFGLGPHADKMSAQLSGGLKRKVMVSIAVIAAPPVLVLDEPTTGLDPRSRREVWSMIRSLQDSGTTTLLTTHYMEEAEALCDRVAVIANGRILAQGSVEELRAGRPRRVRATFLDADGREQEIVAETPREALAALSRLGVLEFTVRRTSLEDIFLELTDEAGVAD
jgi:ABC-2 type transport system ATP-binding protein